MSSDVTRFIAERTVEEYHQDHSDQALAKAREVLGLSAAGTREHCLVGDPGSLIAAWARRLDCDLIVMGARGLSAGTAALVGSVTQHTIAHSVVPVLVVK